MQQLFTAFNSNVNGGETVRECELMRDFITERETKKKSSPEGTFIMEISLFNTNATTYEKEMLNYI